MKVTPMVAPTPTAQQPSSSQSSRERAISMLTAGAPASQSQNAVSAEDMVQNSGLNGNSEDTSATTSEVAPKPPASELEASEEPTLSNEYAILAKREKALRAKQQQADQSLKAREQALAEREAALAAKDAEYKSNYIPKSALKQNAYQILNEEGVSYDQLTQQYIDSSTPIDPRVEATIKAMEAKIKQMEEASQSTQKQQTEAQQASYKAAVQQLTTEATNLVKTDPAFETIAQTGSVKDVVDLIEKTYQADGILMSVEEAAQAVEDHLVEEIEKLMKIQKIQKRMQAASTPATTTPQQTQGSAKTPAQTQPAKTLTNAMASTRQLSARERALAAFKGELK